MSDSSRHSGPDEAWEALLRQLRLQPQAAPQPFFYARVQARLSAKASPADPLLPSWLWRPACAAVLVALVLAASGDGAVAATAHTSSRGSWPVPQLPR